MKITFFINYNEQNTIFSVISILDSDTLLAQLNLQNITSIPLKNKCFLFVSGYSAELKQ